MRRLRKPFDPVLHLYERGPNDKAYNHSSDCWCRVQNYVYFQKDPKALHTLGVSRNMGTHIAWKAFDAKEQRIELARAKRIAKNLARHRREAK